MRVAWRTGLIAAVAAAAGLTLGANNEKKPDKSPHGDAVELVIRTQTDEIRKLENPTNDSWWHDTKERTWVVKRPFAPGVFDSTHLFEVTYRIDGKDVAKWSVDTRKGTATRADAKK